MRVLNRLEILWDVCHLERDCTVYQKSIEAQMNEAPFGDAQPIQVDEGKRPSYLPIVISVFCIAPLQEI